MKQQQLVNSLFLASTAALLATQPACADTLRVKEVRLAPTTSGIEVILETSSKALPPVFAASAGQTLIVDIINTRLRLPKGGTFRAANPTNGISDVTVVPLNASSIRVSVTGKAGLPLAQVVQSAQGLVLNITATPDTALNQARSRPAKSNQSPTTTSTLSRQQASATGHSADKRNSANGKKKARVTPSATPTPASPASPAPTNATLPTQLNPYPSYLNPNSNPLQFPAKPEEVRLRGTQPVTLAQAYAIARRNNRDLQTAQLTLERSKAALRQAQAALYPTLNLSAELNNSGNAFINSPSGQPTIGSLQSSGTGSTTNTGTGGRSSGGTGSSSTTGTGGGSSGGTGSLSTTGTGGAGTSGGGSTTNAAPATSTGSSTINGTGTNTTGGITNTGGAGTTTGTTTGTGTTGITNTGGAGTTTGTTTGTGTTTPSTTNSAPATSTGSTTTGTGTTTSSGTTTSLATTTGGTTAAAPPTTTAAGAPTSPRQVLRSSTTSLFGTLALSYNLYTSGGRSASIRAAKEQVRLDQLAVEVQAETIRLSVATDYYNLQNADQQVLIQEAAVTNALSSLRDAQALEQAGVGTRFDTLRAQVQLANSTQNLTNAQASQQIARRQLSQLLSVSQSVDLSAADPVQIAGLWNLSLEDSVVLAFKNRAELEQQLAQRNIAEQNRRLALSQIGPQVSLGANYNISDPFSSNNPNVSGGGTDTYTVGATARLLLFDGGAARASAAQAEANKAIAEVGFANVRNQIRFSVERDYANLQANLANIQTITVALAEARESLRLARLRFQAGVGTQTDVISAENDLTNTEGNRVAAILNYNISLASLERDITSGQIR